MSLPIDSNIYFEFYAREVLLDFFCDDLFGLQVKDKPDLQNKKADIGIEVTNVLLDNQLEALHLHDKIIDTKDKIDKEYTCGRLKKIDAELLKYDGQIVGISYPASLVTSEPLIRATKTKIGKLNKKDKDNVYFYTHFSHYRLFINTTLISDKRNYLNELIETANIEQINKVRKFETIYVFNNIDKLFECDLVSKSIYEYSVDNKQLKHYKETALRLSGSINK